MPPIKPADIPNEYRCPISKQIIVDPVIFASDGHTYEREQIVKWLLSSDKSPVTGAKLDNKSLVENILARNQIRDFLAKNQDLFDTDEVYFPCDTLLKAIQANDIKKVTEMFRVDPRVSFSFINDKNYTAFQLIAEQGTKEMLADVMKLLTEVKIEKLAKLATPANWKPVVLNQLLFKAVQANQIQDVKKCITLYANINAIDEDNYNSTPLHHAVKLGFKEVVHYLLDCKADFETVATDGSTPLNFSGFYGRDEIASLLIKAGANLHHQDNQGNTPFHDAMQNGHCAAALVFFNAGAKKYIKNIAGETPLTCASEETQRWFAEMKRDYKKIKENNAVETVNALAGKIESLNEQVSSLTEIIKILKVAHESQLMITDELTQKFSRLETAKPDSSVRSNLAISVEPVQPENTTPGFFRSFSNT